MMINVHNQPTTFGERENVEKAFNQQYPENRPNAIAEAHIQQNDIDVEKEKVLLFAFA